MSAQQAEFVAFKQEVVASAAVVAARIAKLEEVATKANADAAAANLVIVELQKSYNQISLQAAPWSAAIQAEVAASEAKATEALSEVRALYEATKSEVEDLRRRASEVEKELLQMWKRSCFRRRQGAASDVEKGTASEIKKMGCFRGGKRAARGACGHFFQY